MNFVIDVHTHLFNADDIPVRGFIKSRNIPDWIAKLLDRLIQKNTPEDRSVSTVGEDRELTDEEIHFLMREIIEEDEELKVLFKTEMECSLATDRLPGMDQIALAYRYIRWLDLIMKNRQTILERMKKTFNSVQLFTPLMMDMEFWLSDPVPTPMHKQILIYEKMIKRSNGLIHPFVPFDPERERVHHGTEQSSLVLIKDAIENRGFIGVKVYPPMGYRPTGNEALSDRFSHGKEYDEFFDAMFEYCSAKQIPITTHCTNGGAEAYKGSGVNADPSLWEPILEKYPDLVVNFAHFGGDDEFVRDKQTSWTFKIAEFMQKYENVYADTGHHNLVFDRKIRRKFFNQLLELVKKFPKVTERFMYGSDFHMIVRAEDNKKFMKRYLDAYSDHFNEGNTTLFMSGNARRFLGLLPGGENRNRLYQFYTRNELELPGWWHF